MQTLTVQKIMAVAQLHKYLILTDTKGNEFGVNAKITNAAKKHNPNTVKTRWTKIRPCEMHEYITKKTPFIQQQQ